MDNCPGFRACAAGPDVKNVLLRRLSYEIVPERLAAEVVCDVVPRRIQISPAGRAGRCHQDIAGHSRKPCWRCHLNKRVGAADKEPVGPGRVLPRLLEVCPGRHTCHCHVSAADTHVASGQTVVSRERVDIQASLIGLGGSALADVHINAIVSVGCSRRDEDMSTQAPCRSAIHDDPV